jgi:hypothetical protein
MQHKLINQTLTKKNNVTLKIPLDKLILKLFTIEFQN